jgi:hypothetical protein
MWSYKLFLCLEISSGIDQGRRRIQNLRICAVPSFYFLNQSHSFFKSWNHVGAIYTCDGHKRTSLLRMRSVAIMCKLVSSQGAHLQLSSASVICEELLIHSVKQHNITSLIRNNC